MSSVLYLGLDPSRYEQEVVHLPLIRTEPRPFDEVEPFFSVPHSHILFTSRTAVEHYCNYTNSCQPAICVGEATAEKVREKGHTVAAIAKLECGEGVVELLGTFAYDHILYPHSARARPLLREAIRGTPFALYDTFFNTVPIPDLTPFSRIVFTSPSTVEAFARLCNSWPPREKCEAIGPITQNALNRRYHG